MALPNPSVGDWHPGQNTRDDQEDGAEIHRITTIWEDTGGKNLDEHQVTGVSAGDLDNSPPRVKLTEEDVSN